MISMGFHFDTFFVESAHLGRRFGSKYGFHCELVTQFGSTFAMRRLVWMFLEPRVLLESKCMAQFQKGTLVKVSLNQSTWTAPYSSEYLWTCCKLEKNSLPKKIYCQVPEDSPGPIAVGMGPQKADYDSRVFVCTLPCAEEWWKTEREFVDWIFT